ncbi:MAG TPA: response regulator [Candidatus Pelethocola excrementipullorum]|nr:response regulator [Candidatus Pelethocola excrementipullorum]
MYKLLIADDDEIICKGLGTCIPWEKHGIQVVGMVHDGELALGFVDEEKPDIVIVDINMPFMDGIEFSYAVRQKYPEIKIILLTAYKEFEYAQKAIQLQVFEYLTKPFSNEEVIDAAVRAVKAIEEEQKYRVKVQKNLEFIYEKQLEELTIYGTVEGEEAIKGQIQSAYHYFQVGIVYLKRIQDEWEDRKKALIDDEVALRMASDQLRKIISKRKGCSLFVQNNRIVLVFEYENREEGKKVKDVITFFMDEVGKDDHVFLVSGVGRVYQGVSKLPASYQEAIFAMEQKYGYGNRSVILYSGIQERTAGLELEIPAIRKRLQEEVQQRDSARIRKELEDLFHEINGRREWNLSSLKFLFIELLGYSWEVTEEEKLYETFLRQSGHLMEKMMSVRTLAELKKIVDRNFQKLYDYLDSQNTTEVEKRINQAVEYIRENYPNPDLNLNEVAQAVHLSASYLGNSLKKYKKSSYVNLLNQVRIENAKRLLTRQEVKTYEVAFLVGFNSSQYFSSSFKKSTGLTPGEFREQVLKR